MPNLMILFLLPFAASFLMFSLRVFSGKCLKRIAICLSLIPLIYLSYYHHQWIGSSVHYAWLPQLSIDFFLKVDALSLIFIYLSVIVVSTSLFAVKCTTLPSPNVFYGLIFLLEGLLIGFFSARDLVVFTIFWESMLLPLYFIINLWGGPLRQMAALKFLIYMFAGSVFMIAAVLALYFANGSNTFNMDELAQRTAVVAYMPLICAVFLLAFSVKTPLFPFHAWLPDAYYEAPPAGTILLSAILSKAGIYGFLRIGMEIFPTYMRDWSPLLLGLAVIGVFYGGLAAWMQKDYKRLIAYSSFSHVNFILAGVFVWNQTAQSGAILQAFNHGITIAALFLAGYWLEQRMGTTAIGEFKGLAKYLPKLCWLTLFFVLSSVALPGTNNFIGELMILFGLFQQDPWWAAFLTLSVILSVIYMLRWMQKVYFEKPTPASELFIDIKTKELLIALPLVLLILWVGIYPTPLLKIIKSAENKITALEPQ
jgi:NADH-quinone oxidoreductase subunit M